MRDLFDITGKPLLKLIGFGRTAILECCFQLPHIDCNLEQAAHDLFQGFYQLQINGKHKLFPGNKGYRCGRSLWWRWRYIGIGSGRAGRCCIGCECVLAGYRRPSRSLRLFVRAIDNRFGHTVRVPLSDRVFYCRR